MITNDSCAMYFDREFVTTNLQNLLRCPKCIKSYTYSYISDQEESCRPIVLSCGHNLCESCVWSNRQDLKCAVCHSPAPPTIIAKDSTYKSVANVCDFYELNYHVLGVTSRYFEGFGGEILNSSISLSSISDEIGPTSKCSECGNEIASGECRQCNTYYCRRCFASVHNHSRLLQSHIFQTTEKATPCSKGLQVGKQYFILPFTNDCQEHHTPKTIYCFQCKRTRCPLCSSTLHRGHRTQSLVVMNQRFASEIPTSLNSLNSALLNIQNGQEVVQAAKQKLNNYASETLANISKRFCHLHGLLQVAELQVIEKLRESSLPPQVALNKALGTLNGYETVIKRLKQALESGSENITGVPDDIPLKWLVKLIHEHIEKIPTTVQVSKIEENPYRMSTSRFMDMTNIPACEFVDPNIQVCFKTDFEQSDCSSSQSSSSGKENIHESNIILTPNLMKKPIAQSQERCSEISWKSHSNLSWSTDELPIQELNFVQNFAELDITKPESTSSTDVEDKSFWFKTYAEVKVICINSPEDFYVQGIHAENQMRKKMEKFARTHKDRGSIPLAIMVGTHYIIYHRDQKCFYRAKVKQKLANCDIYKVFLPDIGLYFDIRSVDFYELPERLAKLPYSAVHCTLSELVPNNDKSEWDTRASAFLKHIVQNKPVHLILKRAAFYDSYEVDLITSNYNTNISIHDCFLYSGLARSRCVQASAMGHQWLQLAPNTLRLPKMTFQCGDELKVQMLHVGHSQEFYVTRQDLRANRLSLQNNLQETMDCINRSHLENIFLGQLHLGCVLQSGGQWKRASIEDVLGNGYVVVRLVDDGVSQKVFWDQLFVLPQNFWHKEMAIKCYLTNVQTREELSYTLDLLTANANLNIVVILPIEDGIYVTLNLTRFKSDTTNVGVQLVSKGCCISSREESSTMLGSLDRSLRLDLETCKFLERKKRKLGKLSRYQMFDKNEQDKLVKVQVLYVRQPDEFYVTLPNLQPAIEIFQKAVQKAAAEMNEHMVPKFTWKTGDMCYINVQAKMDSKKLWHRGIVTEVKPNINRQLFRYQVQLRDLGEVVEDMLGTCLVDIDEDNMRISNRVKRCRLHGIRSNGEGWSEDANKFFLDQLKVYDDIHMTEHCRTNNSLNVVLWGSHTTISESFTPSQTKYVNINKTLLLAGMAEKDLDADEGQRWDWENVSVRLQGSKSNESRALQTNMDQIEWIDTTKLGRMKAVFEHNEDMPPLELLYDLGLFKLTTGQTLPPSGWTTPRKCEKTIFTAFATNVSYECSIYLTLANDKPFMEHMRNLLMQTYKPLMEKQQKGFTSYRYEVGQPVLATYHMDNLIYRGIVQRLKNNHNEYTVYYVDSGNMEQVKADEMLPYAPFPELSAMCFLVTIHGVRSKWGMYNILDRNTVHENVFMKLSNVRVVDSQDMSSGKLPACQIKVGNMDIATRMIDCGISVPIENPSSKKNMPSQNDLKEFKVFNELDNLASAQIESSDDEVPCIRRINETISSAQPPPTKKKYLNNSYFFDEFDTSEVELSSNLSDKKDNKIDANVNDSQMEPPNCLAVDQLKRRINLRQMEIKDKVNFSPLDTSTERSYYDGSSSFKTLRLPNGVNQFKCTVDSVLSATELQIAPCLSEFTKHDISLIQETSSLIKDAEPLKQPKVGDLCLAQYSKDKQWYRALIKEVSHIASPPTSHEATVFYIDFHDTEKVPYNHLKVMPSQLSMFPLRSFRVKLHGLKKNDHFEDKTVRQTLQACLCKYPLVFAQVHYSPNYHTDNFDLIEVELFENKQKKKLVYQSLCENLMLLKKTKCDVAKRSGNADLLSSPK